MQVARRFAVIFGISVALAMAGITTANAAPNDLEFVPGELIVKFKPSSSTDERVRSLSHAGASSTAVVGTPRTRVVDLAPGEGVGAALGKLRRSGDIAWAEPNYVISATKTPNDPFFASGDLWGMRNTGQTVEQYLADGDAARKGTSGMDIGDATSAWDLTTGSDDVLVGIVDSGIFEHPDLNANLRTGLSRDLRHQPEESPDPHADSEGHGTHVAGTIGAVGDNGTGVTGVNWDVGLVSLRAMDPMTGTAADIASAFAHAGQLGLPVVNASLGTGAPSRAMADALRLAPETLFVIAAGNDGIDVDGGGATTYPCAFDFDNIVCVAALGNTGRMSHFSNYGRRSVDLGAPGNKILSTHPTYQSVLDLPVDAASFGDDWETGPEGQEWEVVEVELGSDEVPVLASNPQPEDGGGIPNGLKNYIQNEEAIDLTGLRGCVLKGFYDADFGTPEEPVQMMATFERTVEGFNWLPIGSIAASSQPDLWPQFGYSLHADGAEQVAFRIRVSSREEVSDGLHGLRILEPSVRCLDDDSSDYKRLSGTSMAAPHVAGAAALLLSHNPDLSTEELRDAIIDTVQPTSSLEGKTTTGGRLDVNAALAAAEPEPGPLPELNADVWVNGQDLRRHRGIDFKATSDVNAGLIARAAIRWRGQRVWVIGSRVLSGGPGSSPLRRIARRLAARYRDRGIENAALRARHRVITLANRGRPVTVRPGRIVLDELTGAPAAPWNEHAATIEAGRITSLRLGTQAPQLRRLLRLQRLRVPLVARLAARATEPGHQPTDVMRHDFRVR